MYVSCNIGPICKKGDYHNWTYTTEAIWEDRTECYLRPGTFPSWQATNADHFLINQKGAYHTPILSHQQNKWRPLPCFFFLKICIIGQSFGTILSPDGANRQTQDPRVIRDLESRMKSCQVIVRYLFLYQSRAIHQRPCPLYLLQAPTHSYALALVGQLCVKQ